MNIKSDFARDALVIAARDTGLCEDYEYYNKMIDYLADRLVCELNSERWERERAEEAKISRGDTENGDII